MNRKQIALQVLNSLILSGVNSDLIKKTASITDEFIKEFSKDQKQKPKTSVDNFLDWFNNRKEVYLGSKGRFKELTRTDYNNYLKLKKYTKEDFEIAVKNMFSNSWAIENNMCTPSHFLRIENFNKYVSQNKKDKDILKKDK